MSDDAITPTPQVDTVEPDTATVPDDDTADTPTGDPEADSPEASTANREAARYRRRLRDAEGERDKLTERLGVLQRAEAERLAADHLSDGADLFRDGIDIADLLDDDGNIDAGRIVEAVGVLAAAHPHWIKRAAPKQIRRGGLSSGATSPGQHSTTSWSKVLRGPEK